ncbi:MAG TPA: TonB-dependent receptor [Pyrinomonadaceae bacterium]|nr:TonB-dependent receptor [Pyrinomonadaceae bacterium]
MNGVGLCLRARACASAVVCALLALGAQVLPDVRAQDLDDVQVTGRVSDEHGASVAGASVKATLKGSAVAREAETDGEGRYRLVELAPGEYVVRVSREGFAAEERTNVSTLSGQTVRLDFVLRAAGPTVEETVVSAAETPPVDTSRTVAGGTVTRAEAEDIPVATRSPLDLLFTLPGVAEEPLSTRDAAEDRDPAGRATRVRAAETPEEAGTHALAGAPAYSNNVTVDGHDNNDDRSARERFRPSLEAVEEVQVVTSQFSAEYGRASGGRVNLRTRAGSASLRGRLFHFFRDESLDANTWNNNRRGLKRLPFQQHVAGCTLGGPVAPHVLRGRRGDRGAARTFFFVAHEYDTTLDSALVDALVPVEQNDAFPLPRPTTLEGRRFEPSATPPNAPAELAPFVEHVSTPARSHALTARLDRTYSSAHNGTLLFQFGRQHDLRQFGGGLRLAESLQGRARRTDALSYTDNFVFSPSLVNQLRAQVSSLRPALKARGRGGDANSPVVLIDIDDPLASNSAPDRSGTLVAGSSTSGASDRRETRLQLQNTLTALRGAHALKVGADLQRVRSTFTDLADRTGTYTFASAGDFLASAPARFRQRFDTSSTQKNFYAAVFVQDEWRATSRLTLSYGLRYERETILRDADNFAPRVGLALDPLGTGRTVMRLGAGVFYNRALLRTIDDFALGRQTLEFDTNNLPPAARRAFIAANLRFPETLSPDSPLVRQFGARLLNFSRRLDPALRAPEGYQVNAGFERGLGRRLVVEANYTFTRGLHLWREFNANAPVLPRGFRDFADYLLSRDFANFRDAAGTRPVYDAQGAGDFVRFTAAPTGDPNAVGRAVEFGVPVTIFNLNSLSPTAIDAALAALQDLRPDPGRGQVEQLAAVGNSFYHGLTFEARVRRARARGFDLSLRAGYTLSRLVDDGNVNTSSAQRAGDFRAERARGLLDRRHRFVLSGTLDTPRLLGRLRLAAVLRAASGSPFNVSAGGSDRNLDDVSNDRPDFSADPALIRWRRPGHPLDPRLLQAFSLPLIGRAGGTLPRNAGLGPALFTFDLNLTREFRLSERLRLRPNVEFGNALNARVFTFAAEFVNFSALRPSATPGQRRAFLDSFLVPARTLRPRAVRLGMRLDF